MGKKFWMGAAVGAAAGAACACLGWIVHEVLDMAEFARCVMRGDGEDESEGRNCECGDCDGNCGDRTAEDGGVPAPPMIVLCMGMAPFRDSGREDEDECVDVPDGRDDPSEVAWI